MREGEGAGQGTGAAGGMASVPGQEADEVSQINLFRARAAQAEDAAASEEVYMPRAPRPALLQIHNSFILAETRDGVIILDQHAAHERILYERIIAGFGGEASEGQRLLFPFTVRLTKPELEIVESVSEPWRASASTSRPSARVRSSCSRCRARTRTSTPSSAFAR